MRRGIRAVAAAIAVAALLVGCTSGQSKKLPTQTSTPVSQASSASATSAKDAAAVRSYYSQALVWKDCDDGFQCATAKAPLDWAKPAGASISLSMIRKPASGTKVGSLFVNPGGPGASAVSFVRDGNGNTSATLREHFDVIGVDPRGVGASSPVKCYDDKQLDGYLYDIPPGERGSAEWITAYKKSVADLGAACLKQTGALLGHVDTESTVRDLDMLRADVGDTKLNYLGFSYGTMIGSIYADLFPHNVGRMVLDGVTDPAIGYDELTELQAVGFESNLKAYAQWCLTQDKDCPFRGSVDGVLQAVSAQLKQVSQSPIKNSDGRLLGASTLVTAIIRVLYNTESWSVLDTLFRDVGAGSAKVAFYLADDYNDRDQNGHYTTNNMVAFEAIDCLDYTYDDKPADMAAEAAHIAQLAPTIGPYLSYGGISCAGWPFKPTRVPAPVHGTGAAPILVVGTTNDPATPYSEAVSVSKELESAHLVTWNGSGHTAYGRSNSCVKNTVDDYLVKGTVPASDPKC